jgi:integrase
MRHGALIQTRTFAGEPVWIIVKAGIYDDRIIDWQQALYAQDVSPNTVRAYVYDLSKLWDFQAEYGDHYDLAQTAASFKMLSHFKTALLHGDERLGWGPKQKTSVKRILNSVNSYSDYSFPELSNPTVMSHRVVMEKGKGFFAHLRDPILKPQLRRLVRVKIMQLPWDGKYFPIKHIGSLLVDEPCARDQCLYALLATGGLRLSEALNLWIDDVTYENGRIIVKVNDPEKRRPELWKKFRILPDPHIRNKGRANDEVFFLDDGDFFLQAFERYIFTQRPPTEEHPYLFVNLKSGKHYGKRFKPHSARDHLSARCKQLGIDDYGPHSLRHFYGVYAVNVMQQANPKITLDVIQSMMGHATIESTKKYAVFWPETIRQMVDEAFLKIKKDGKMAF